MIDNGFLRCSNHKSQEAYLKAVDKAIEAHMDDYSRKEMDPDLVIYEKESDEVVRLVFFNKKDMSIFISYMLELDKTDTISQYDSDEFLLLNYVLRFAKFAKDLDGQIEINYSFSVRCIFCMADLNYYLEHMERTLEEYLK